MTDSLSDPSSSKTEFIPSTSFECSVCYCSLKVPRVLECGHVFCTTCLLNLKEHALKKNLGLLCPECRNPTRFCLHTHPRVYLIDNSPECLPANCGHGCSQGQQEKVGAYDPPQTDTGNQNTFIGVSSLNTTGMNNTFIGWDAGATLTTGMDNTFIGWNAGSGNITGMSSNVFIGASSLNTTGMSSTSTGPSVVSWGWAGHQFNTAGPDTYIDYQDDLSPHDNQILPSEWTIDKNSVPEDLPFVEEILSEADSPFLSELD